MHGENYTPARKDNFESVLKTSYHTSYEEVKEVTIL